MSNKPPSNQSGLTIVELMLGLLISSLVMATFMVVTRNYANSADDFRGASKLSLSIRSFSDHLNLHASSAGLSHFGSQYLPPVDPVRRFSLNDNTSSPSGNWTGPYARVFSLKFAYDSDKSTRQFAHYQVESDSKKGRSQNRIMLTRRFEEYDGSIVTQTMMFQRQIVLDDVDSFTCIQRLVGNTAKAMDCRLVIFTEDAPDASKTLTYEFTIATLQTF